MEADADGVATELDQHVSGMTAKQPLCNNVQIVQREEKISLCVVETVLNTRIQECAEFI